MDRVKVGVIGTGGMGGRHAYNIARLVPDAQLTAVMDADEGRAAQLTQEIAGVQTFTDAHELVSSAQVDAVIIASPDFTHAELAVACIEKSKPVLCEKPLATSADESKQVVEAELALGQRMLQLGFMREYDPAHRRVMAMLKQQNLGLPLYLNAIHINKGDGVPRSIEDVITNSAVHDIHSARFMMPGEIVRVNACVVADTAPGSCRLVTISVEYDNGNIGLIECDAQAGYGYEVSVRIRCQHGAVETQTVDYAISRDAGSLQSEIAPDWLIRFDEAYVLEVRDWIASIRAQQVTGPSAWDGYRSLCIADQCIASVHENRPHSVTADVTPDLYRSAD